MTPSLDTVAEAFSRKALVYDAFGKNHPNLADQRLFRARGDLGIITPRRAGAQHGA